MSLSLSAALLAALVLLSAAGCASKNAPEPMGEVDSVEASRASCLSGPYTFAAAHDGQGGCVCTYQGKAYLKVAEPDLKSCVRHCIINLYASKRQGAHTSYMQRCSNKRMWH